MRRFFVQNIFFLLLVNLIVKPLWIFGIDRNVQIAVGHEDYGQYIALLNFSIIFQILLDWGLQSYNSKTVAQAPETVKRLFPNIIIAKGVLSLVYLFIVLGLGMLLGYRGHVLVMLFVLGFLQVINSLLLYLRSNISAMHHFKTDSVLSVSDRLFMIIICSVLLFHPSFRQDFKIEWFIYAQIVASLLSTIVAFALCLRISSFQWGNPDLKKVWIIGKQSVPYALLIFLMAIYIRADVFLMERFLPDGPKEAGIYASAIRFLDVANNVTGVLFAGMLLPIFGRLIAKKESVRPLVRLCTNLLLPIAITASIAALFLGKEIMKASLGDLAGDYGGQVLSVLMLAFPGYCIGYLYATLVTATGSLRPLIRNASIAVAVNLGANFILMPLYGAWGAAMAACITQLFLSVANIRTAQNILHLKTDLKWLSQYVVFILLVVLSAFLLHYSGLGLFMYLFILAASAVLAMLICGFLPIKKILELLKNR